MQIYLEFSQWMLWSHVTSFNQLELLISAQHTYAILKVNSDTQSQVSSIISWFTHLNEEQIVFKDTVILTSLGNER